MTASWLAALDGARAGRYRYLLNDVEQPVTEQWAVVEDDEGPRLWSERCAGDVRLTLNLCETAAGPQSGRAQLQWERSGASIVTADYDLSSWCYSVTRSAGNLSPARWQCAITSPLLLAPLLRISAGAVVRALLNGEAGAVLVPRIDRPDDDASLLEPMVEERQVRLLEREAIQVAGREWDSLCCEYRSARYGPGTRFWISEAGLLLRYCWQQEEQQRWQVDLCIDD